MSLAFVIGNGASRSGVDLSTLAKKGVLYGCNALYRDYAPHYELPHFLVAIDDGMIAEIRASKFPKDRFIVPPYNERWEPAECNPARPRSNAGMAAMIEAIRRGAETIVGVGFDFLLSGQQSVSNLYDGTPNYGPETRAVELDNSGRARYLNWLACKNPNVDFYFAYPNEERSPYNWGMTGGNMHMTTFSELEKI